MSRKIRFLRPEFNSHCAAWRGLKNICAAKVGFHLAYLGQCELPTGVFICNTSHFLVSQGCPLRAEAEDGELTALRQTSHEEIHGFQSNSHPIVPAHAPTAVQHEDEVKV